LFSGTNKEYILKKKPFVSLDQVKEIVKTYPTPFHIYDEKGMRENAEAVKEAFAWNKGFREYFAVKAEPNPFIMEIFKEYGCGADCSSMAELELSHAVGLTGDAIMFSSNDTPAEEFVRAKELGAIINLDDFTHIEYFEKVAGPFPKKMCLRYNPGGVYQLSNGIMDNPGDSKYGLTKEQLIEGYRILKEKGVEEFGLHSFLVSNTVTNDYYPELAKTLFDVCVEVKEKTGVEISFVNLSGGVGIPYEPDQTPNDIRVIGAGVERVFNEVMVPAGLGNAAIYTEMGRFMTGPYGGLVTRAIHEKHIYKEYIGVDACAANLMRPAMYGSYHHITVLGKEDAACDHKYDVTGSLCENNDKFAVDRMLPKIDMGDYLFIHDTGAHGFAMGYNYNGRLHSAELLLKTDGSVQLIRRAQTLEDYFATFDVFDQYKQLAGK
jgi:diaminopimelate decarboxylase